ncbi:ATP-binding protein [Jiangella anatolica]|uniref:ATP-binding protein n=1 Tax=Jiangella anatolica TaxID=2670374 RepID=A0A2W2B0U8_9ACTN|nr:ATP-binding protein [Jiangella anatolica]PZF79612.1 hypothetical protein C1I92_30335 [Jiangella anatolica]
MPELVPRAAARRLHELADHLRVVMVSGPRQAGKTTLLRQYLADAGGGSFRTLDRADTLAAARDDPASFAAFGDPPRVIDEVQLGGDALVRAIKVSVDDDPTPGRFILSGSSRFLTIPTLSESLAGRVAFVDLWPLSLAERTRAGGNPLNWMFADDVPLAESPWTRSQYLDSIVGGGFPEALAITSPLARRAWFDGYLSTVVTRDIRDFATVARGDAVARLVGLIAARAGGTAVLADLAQGADLARDTARSYLSYLDMVYLTMTVPAWSTNLTSRLSKTPKLYPTDSGLAAHLLDVGVDELAEPGHPALGPLLETFVATELLKAIAAADGRFSLSHLRTADRREVDFILEGPRGRIVAVEVKASASPGAAAVKGLRWLRERLGDRLHAGILLHLGHEAASRGDGVYTVPISALWDHAPLPAGSL